MMPPRHWPPQRQRLLALGLGTLLIVFVFAIVLGPAIHKHRQYDLALDNLASQTKRLDTIIARRDSIAAEKQWIADALAATDTTLPPVGASVAGARLQTLLQDIAADTDDFIIDTAQIMEPESDASFTRISVRIQARGNTAGVKNFLHRLEYGRPITWTEEFQIQQDRRARGASIAQSLQITMVVSALMTNENLTAR